MRDERSMMSNYDYRDAGRRSPLWGFVWGAVMVLAAVALVYLLSNILQARDQMREDRAAASQLDTMPPPGPTPTRQTPAKQTPAR